MNCNALIKRHFHGVLRRDRIRKIRFHDLGYYRKCLFMGSVHHNCLLCNALHKRYTYAALLIDQGEHPKYIQAQMGYYSINVTMDTYGYLMKAVNREASKRLEEKIFGKSGNNLVPNRRK